MAKMVMCVTRHPDLSPQEFRDYWLNNHGPLFRKHAAALKATRYVQSHTLDTPINDDMRKSRGTLPAYDGIAEITFNSEQDFLDAVSTPEGQAITAELRDNESKFVDLAKSSVFFVQEHVL
ncbi:MAG: EthD domain-containing protein [Gammaproteobacteria bacterium]|jgi:uncharacterized protein (TIGR02118 family)|nr:EthD domain-containing protein [Gammaproteobacteria bacterium]